MLIYNCDTSQCSQRFAHFGPIPMHYPHYCSRLGGRTAGHSLELAKVILRLKNVILYVIKKYFSCIIIFILFIYFLNPILNFLKHFVIIILVYQKLFNNIKFTSRNFYNRLVKIEVKKSGNSVSHTKFMQSQVTRILYRNNYFLLQPNMIIILIKKI